MAELQGYTTHTDTSNQELFAAAGVGMGNVLTTVIVTNASSSDTEVLIKDGSTTIGQISAPANGGAICTFENGLKTSANAAMNVSAVDSVTSVFVTGTGKTESV